MFRYGLKDAIDDGYDVKGLGFETIVYKILKRQGYQIEIVPQRKDLCYDLQADKGEEHFAIEVKGWEGPPISRDIVHRLEEAARKEKRTPVLISANPDLERVRAELLLSFGTVILSIQNLMYMAAGDLELENALKGVLGYSLEGLEPVSPPILLDHQNAGTEETDMVRIMERVGSWDAEKESNTGYEDLCCEVLKILFDADLSLWKRQQCSNDGLDRFDLVCRIKDENVKGFWKLLENHYESKYIVFEFKNYKGPITQKEITITSKYLYKKALRGAAIMISANGADAGAFKESRGILRDESKLIINLSNSDLVEMLKRKMDHKDPAEYLGEKLDELLIRLEK